MSLGFGSFNNRQDFDLNLAPCIDAITVLIAFMLASASFLAIGIFDATVAADTAVQNESKPPPIRIDVLLTTDKQIVLSVQGKLRQNTNMPPKDGSYNSERLVRELKSLQSRFPETQGYVLNTQDDVEYDSLIQMMEVLRHDLPKLSVLLGGL